MTYVSTAIKKTRYLVTRDTDQVLVFEKNNGAFIDLVLDTPAARDAAISTAVNALLAGAPGALNTLNELATALGDDANFATTITTALGNRLAWRANWAATTDYVRNDVVLFNGGLYVAPSSFTSGASFVKANWVELVPQTNTFLQTSVAGSGSAVGRTASVSLSGTPNPNTGSIGLRLGRDALGNPLTIAWYDGATFQWDMGLDNLTSDFVFINDPTVGDQLRYRKGGHLLFGLSVPQPALTYRMRIDTVLGDDVAMVDNLVLTSNIANANLIRNLRVFSDAGEIFTVSATRATAIGIGTAAPATFIHGSLGQNATTQFLLQNLTAGAASKVGLRLSSDAKAVFLEQFSSTFTTTSLANVAMLYTNNTDLLLGSNSIERVRITAAGGVVIGTTALATTATDGYFRIPSMAGAPTGVPTVLTNNAGAIPIGIRNQAGKYSIIVNVGGGWLEAPLLALA